MTNYRDQIYLIRCNGIGDAKRDAPAGCAGIPAVQGDLPAGAPHSEVLLHCTAVARDKPDFAKFLVINLVDRASLPDPESLITTPVSLASRSSAYCSPAPPGVARRVFKESCINRNTI